jgi:hypothetical protein
MMAKMKAEMQSNQEEMTARLEAKIEAKVDIYHEKFEVLQGAFISWMDIHQARTEGIQEEIIVQMDAHRERMRSSVNAWQKETVVSQEATEACLESKEPTSVELVFVSEHQEVPKEDAAVKNVRALKKRRGDQHLILRCRVQLKKRTQGNNGSRKKLATTHRGMTCHAIPAPCKGDGSSGTRPGQCWKRNLERMDNQEETLGKTRKDHWNKEPRLKMAIISGKQNNTQQDFQEDHRAGDRKANSRDFH